MDFVAMFDCLATKVRKNRFNYSATPAAVDPRIGRVSVLARPANIFLVP
jgi:hypothetical protein